MTGAAISDIRAAIRERVPIEQVALKHVRSLLKSGREYKGLCPFHNERTPSFTVVPAKRFFKCFGCQASGDVVTLVMRLFGLSYGDAIKRLTTEHGLEDPAEAARAKARADEWARRRAAERAQEEAWRKRQALDVWALSAPDSGLVARYLRSRGIDVDLLGGVPEDLRLVQRLEHWQQREQTAASGRSFTVWGQSFAPAMVAAIRDVAGDIIAVHCTWLKPDGSGKAAFTPAKKIFGPWYGGAIRLTPAGRQLPDLAVGEGIESSLSYWLYLIKRGLAPAGAAPGCEIWAAGTLGNICGAGLGRGGKRPTHDKRYRLEKAGTHVLPARRPDPDRPGIRLPDGIKRLTICRENDSKDPAGYEAQLARAVARYGDAGLELSIADPGMPGDFNDLVRAWSR